MKRTGKSNEPPVRAKASSWERRPRLAENRQRQRTEFRAPSRAVSNRTRHAFADDLLMLQSDVELRSFDWMKVAGGRNMRFKQVTAVYQSRVCGEQLNRRNLNMIALADSFTRVAIALIGNTIGFRDANAAVAAYWNAFVGRAQWLLHVRIVDPSSHRLPRAAL